MHDISSCNSSCSAEKPRRHHSNMRSFYTCSSSITSPSRDSFRRARFETDYPKFKRSHSTKRYHITPNSIFDRINEELNEDECRERCPSYRSDKLFNTFTVMPKEDILLFDPKAKGENLKRQNSKNNMDIIPEMDDELLKEEDTALLIRNLRIKIQSDISEDEKIDRSKTFTATGLNKTHVDEDDIIKEENETGNDQEVECLFRNLNKHKFQTFIDKEEPPAKDLPEVQGDLSAWLDVIKEDGAEEEQKLEVKELIRLSKKTFSNSKILADEIDEEEQTQGMIPSMIGPLPMEDEIINESDEFGNDKN